MDDSLFMRRRQPVRNLHSVLNRLTLGQGSVEFGAQAVSFQKLRDNEGCAGMVPDIVNGKDIGMIERRYRPSLLLEATQAVGFAADRLVKDLESDLAPEARIPRAIHLSHSPGADGGDDLEGSELRTGSQSHLPGDYTPQQSAGNGPAWG